MTNAPNAVNNAAGVAQDPLAKSISAMEAHLEKINSHGQGDASKADLKARDSEEVSSKNK